jgi:hypothetical protein
MRQMSRTLLLLLKLLTPAVSKYMTEGEKVKQKPVKYYTAEQAAFYASVGIRTLRRDKEKGMVMAEGTKYRPLYSQPELDRYKIVKRNIN